MSNTSGFICQALHSAVCCTLLLVAGVAIALSVWVIPIIQMAPTTKVKTNQFCKAFELGGRYLQSSSRASALIVLLLGIQAWRSPDVGLASWTVYAKALCLLVTVAPYEINFMFPVNDTIKAWQQELAKQGLDNFGTSRDKEIDRLLTQWQKRQVARIVLPLAAALLLLPSS